MKTFILGGGVAFFISCLTMPFFAGFSRRLGAVSDTGWRHVGGVPIGRLGGGGALLGFISSIVVQYLTNHMYCLLFVMISKTTRSSTFQILVYSL
jgi:hypothetical protein